MRIGVRGHDIAAATPEVLGEELQSLGVHEIQLVAHKSFPGFVYSTESVAALADVFDAYGISVAVYGCYVDPLTEEGRDRFHRHIQYAKRLHAGAIATESGVGITHAQENETIFQTLVEVFQDFSKDAADNGVRTAIETVSMHPICSPERTRRFLDAVSSDNLYAILDPVNLMQEPSVTRMDDLVRRAVSLYGDRILAVHWKADSVRKEDPAIRFACGNPSAVVVTEGLTGHSLRSVVGHMKEF